MNPFPPTFLPWYVLLVPELTLELCSCRCIFTSHSLLIDLIEGLKQEKKSTLGFSVHGAFLFVFVLPSREVFWRHSGLLRPASVDLQALLITCITY